jgi:hypothetical protein
MNSTNVGAQISFAPARTLGVSYSYTNVIMEDINNDNIKDAILSTNANYICLYLGQADGGIGQEFKLVKTLEPVDNVIVKDIDHDNLKEIIYQTNTSLRMLQNKGNVEFQDLEIPTYNGEDIVNAIDIVDFNQDGNLDIIKVQTTYSSVSSVSYQKGIGNGVFLTPITIADSVSIDSYETILKMADLNGDGSNDLIWANSLGIQSQININSVLSNTQTLVEISSSSISNILLQDLNNDNLLDIVYTVRNTASPEVYVSFNMGDFVFSPSIALNFPTQTISISWVNDIARNFVFIDVDNNGLVDILSHHITNAIFLNKNLGNGNFGFGENILNDVSMQAIDKVDNNRLVIIESNKNFKIYTIEDTSLQEQQTINHNIGNTTTIQTVDINKDNVMDIVFTNDGIISYYLGNEEKKYFERYNILDSLLITNMYIADWERDGDMDVLFNTNESIKLMLQNEAGNWEAPLLLKSFYVGIKTTIYTDVDNDNFIDILFLSNNGDFGYLKNVDSNEPITYTSADQIHQIYCNDVNGDGHNDIITYNNQYRQLKWYDGTTNLPLSEIPQILRTFTQNPMQIIPVEVTNDRRCDFFIMDYFLSLYVGTPDNDIELSTSIVDVDGGNLPLILTDAYIDSDDLKDIVIETATWTKWYKNLGNEDTEEHLLSRLAGQHTFIYAGNTSNPSNKDIFIGGTNGINWYPNNGETPFITHEISLNAQGARCVYAADLDNDGFRDILSASENDNKIAWYRNNNDRTFSPEIIVTTDAQQAQAVTSADLDNDGWQDVISASKGDHIIAWYRNNGNGSFSTKQEISSFVLKAKDVVSFDIDKDGDMDIASVGEDVIGWQLHRNNGNGTFQTTLIQSAITGANAISVYDGNNDGWLDVYIASRENNKVLRFNNVLGGANWQQVYVYDVDSPTDVQAMHYYNNISPTQGMTFATSVGGTGIQSIGYDGYYNNTIISEIPYPSSLAIADINEDGEKDLICASLERHTIEWYGATGFYNSLSWQKNIITNQAHKATSVYAADLDNDGDQDILSASLLDDKIAWYENKRGDFPVGIKPSTLPNAAANTLHLYPNPTHDQVVVESPQNEGKPYTLSLYSIEGRLLWQSSSITHSLATVDMGTYPSGMYLLQWQGEQQTIAARCIKY